MLQNAIAFLIPVAPLGWIVGVGPLAMEEAPTTLVMMSAAGVATRKAICLE